MRIALDEIALSGGDWDEAAGYVLEAERLGVDGAWIGEGWGGRDAATPVAYLAAKTSRIKLGTGIIQVGVRSPTIVAMTAASLAAMSHDRFLLGLGTSGPLVIEAMHGVPYAGAVTRLRETVEIIRLATSGERIAYDGKHYKIPLPGGQGRPLRLGVPARHIPIYLASLGPKSLELTGELADGWLSAWFLPDHADMYFDPIRAGARRAGRSFEDIDLQVRVLLAFSDDIEPMRELAKATFAREMGMMGSRTHHFFNDVYRRLGYGELADTAHSLWQEGRREEAAALIPEDFAMQAHLLGTDAMVKDQIRRFRDVGVTTLRLHPQGATTADKLTSVGRLMDLVDAVNKETVASPV